MTAHHISLRKIREAYLLFLSIFLFLPLSLLSFRLCTKEYSSNSHLFKMKMFHWYCACNQAPESSRDQGPWLSSTQTQASLWLWAKCLAQKQASKVKDKQISKCQLSWMELTHLLDLVLLSPAPYFARLWGCEDKRLGSCPGGRSIQSTGGDRPNNLMKAAWCVHRQSTDEPWLNSKELRELSFKKLKNLFKNQEG